MESRASVETVKLGCTDATQGAGVGLFPTIVKLYRYVRTRARLGLASGFIQGLDSTVRVAVPGPATRRRRRVPPETGSGAAKSFTPSRRARPRGDSATPDTRRPRLRVTVRGTAACEREPKRSSIKILGYRKNSAYFIYKSRNIQANATGSHTPLDLQRQPLDEAGPWIRGPGRGRHHNN